MKTRIRKKTTRIKRRTRTTKKKKIRTRTKKIRMMTRRRKMIMTHHSLHSPARKMMTARRKTRKIRKMKRTRRSPRSAIVQKIVLAKMVRSVLVKRAQSMATCTQKLSVTSLIH